MKFPYIWPRRSREGRLNPRRHKLTAGECKHLKFEITQRLAFMDRRRCLPKPRVRIRLRNEYCLSSILHWGSPNHIYAYWVYP
jgi:hypothetical protein